MIDRFGAPIIVGWPAHHILWLRAAMTLEAHKRRSAYQDITDMTGRSYACVWQMACRLEREDNIQRRRALTAERSRAWLARQAAE